MKRNLLELYALIVCVFTLIVFTVSAGMIIKSALTLAYPDLMIVWYYRPYERSDPYASRDKRESSDSLQENKTPEQLEQEEEAREIKERKKYTISEIKRAKRDIIDSLIYLFLSALFYGLHWRLGKRERRRREELAETT